MRWVEVTVCTTSAGADAMSEMLMEHGVTGVSIEDRADVEMMQRRDDEWDYIDENIFSSLNGLVHVKAYLQENGNEQEKVASIRRRAMEIANDPLLDGDFGGGEVYTCSIADEDWSENWKKYYQPFNVGNRLAVRPCWLEYEPENRAVIELEPGAAFGTGLHETTLMCLQLCDSLATEGIRALDIGCGTGILAIGALLLGAQSALLVDRDEVAVAAARHNIERNRCTDRAIVWQGDLADGVDGKYDLIFANIVADAVIRLLPDAKNLLAEGGSIITSGIILEREQDVARAAEANGLVISERLNKGEWVALRLTVA